MKATLTIVDAFTAEPFRGNPAAVCFLDQEHPEAWMQQVAAEMNLSETAFLIKTADAWRLRWFTPKTEVPLCGHATLASAHALWTTGRLGDDQEARFDTKSGRLTARLTTSGIEMDFPAVPVAPRPLPEALGRALGVTPVASLHTVCADEPNFLLELESEQAVRAVRPDFAALRGFAPGLIVTAPGAGPEWDFVSRYFAVPFGIDEDPVTGSAHCSLAPYWAGRLGRTEFVAYQASARGGVVGCALRGDRVALRGEAVTILRGELTVP